MEEDGREHSFDAIAGELLVEACTELFEAYGAHLQPADAGGLKSEVHLAAGIGFVHPKVRGFLALGMSADFAQQLNPTRGPDDQTVPYDWVGELVNQLLARLKGKLMGWGLSLALATPLVFKGAGIQMLAVERARAFCFSDGKFKSVVWLDTTVDPSLVMERAEADKFTEGDAVFF